MAKFARFDPRNKKQYKKNDRDKHLSYDVESKPLKYDKLKHYAEDYIETRAEVVNSKNIQSQES